MEHVLLHGDDGIGFTIPVEDVELVRTASVHGEKA
jgi:hypothetical protein